MSRTTSVPVDMASEQKEILGVVSKRQLLYLIVGGIILYSYVPLIFTSIYPINFVVAIILSLVSATPIIFLVGYLGFMKKEKLNMNNDFYWYIKIQKKWQYGSWRRGNN